MTAPVAPGCAAGAWLASGGDLVARTNHLLDSLGKAVASASVREKLDRQVRLLDQIEADLKRLPRRLSPKREGLDE